MSNLGLRHCSCDTCIAQNIQNIHLHKIVFPRYVPVKWKTEQMPSLYRWIGLLMSWTSAPFNKIWKISVEASVVVPKFCSLHGCFQTIASPSWAPLPGTWATTRVDSTKQFALWTIFGGRCLSKQTTHILFVCLQRHSGPMDGQKIVNHPRCNSVCCHVAHGTHKTEPEGFGVFVL